MAVRATKNVRESGCARATRRNAPAPKLHPATLRQEFLDALPAHIAVLNNRGDIVAVNESWRRFARDNGGATLPGLIEGGNYIAVCRKASAAGSADAARVLQALEAIIAQRLDRFTLEYRCDAPAVLRWFEVNLLRRPELGGVLVTHTNCTERKLAERALRENEERLRLAVDTVALGFYERDVPTNAVTANANFRVIMGLPAEGPVDPNAMRQSLHPADRERVLPLVDQAFDPRLRIICAADFRIIRPDGRVRWVAGRGRVIFDERQDPPVALKLLAVLQDITERKQTEQALRASETHFRTLAESLPQLVWTCRPDGYCDYLGRQWVEYTGVPAEKHFGQNWSEALHPDDREWSLQSWKQAVNGEAPYDLEYRIRRHDGAYRWFKTRAFPLCDASGRVVEWFGTCTDINEIVEARETLARSRAELERLVDERTARLRESVAELEHFSYTIAHDMRAPLRALESFAEILCLEYADRLDDVGRDYTRRISEAAIRMDRLVTDALNYSKVIRTEMELGPVETGALLRGMLESYLEFQLPHAEIELIEPLPDVIANTAGLTQCFSNLLTNATKFVEKGKLPRVRVWAEERTAPQSTQTLVRLWFEDNGIGIPSDQLNNIFRMFERVSTEYEGTGVGLALVQKVVERMKGRTGVESSPGQGSKFWIELAKARVSSAAASEALPARNAAAA